MSWQGQGEAAAATKITTLQTTDLENGGVALGRLARAELQLAAGALLALLTAAHERLATGNPAGRG